MIPLAGGWAGGVLWLATASVAAGCIVGLVCVLTRAWRPFSLDEKGHVVMREPPTEAESQRRQNIAWVAFAITSVAAYISFNWLFRGNQVVDTYTWWLLEVLFGMVAGFFVPYTVWAYVLERSVRT